MAGLDPVASAHAKSFNSLGMPLHAMTTPDPSANDSKQPHRPPGALDVVLSVLSSFFGVQNSRNQQRDFQQGQPIHFIIVGVGLTLLLILGIWLAVKFALRAAAG